MAGSGLAAQHVGVGALRVAAGWTDLDLLAAHLVAGVDDQSARPGADVDHHTLLEVLLPTAL